jgi:hypothetical protein
MSGREGRWIACSVCVWLVASLGGSADAKPAGLAPARVAAKMAKIIRRDAHEQYLRSMTAVKVTKGCCGRQVLRVHYQARTKGDRRKDAYILRLDTVRGRLRGVAVSEFAREAGYRAETGRWENEWRDEFALHYESHAPDRGWKYSLFYSEVSRVERSSGGGGPIGLGASRECELPTLVPMRLYQKVLALFRNAARRVSSTALPFTYC